MAKLGDLQAGGTRIWTIHDNTWQCLFPAWLNLAICEQGCFIRKIPGCPSIFFALSHSTRYPTKAPSPHSALDAWIRLLVLSRVLCFWSPATSRTSIASNHIEWRNLGVQTLWTTCDSWYLRVIWNTNTGIGKNSTAQSKSHPITSYWIILNMSIFQNWETRNPTASYEVHKLGTFVKCEARTNKLLAVYLKVGNLALFWVAPGFIDWGWYYP